MFASFRREIKPFLARLPQGPGVYSMVSAEQVILYVGKARNLRKRISSYFRTHGVGPKQRALMQHTVDIEFTLTHTEGEALILENNLIKQHKPRYNVLLRDDKSYPYIYISTQDPFPRLAFYRGNKKNEGRYFGPYPSAGAVRQSLNLLQKLFRVRQCEDSFFRNRSRPCLQYQIKRCTAPCVGLVSEAEYAQSIRHAILFLEGRSQAVIDTLVEKMEQASACQDYELAIQYRDQIKHLRQVTEHQYMENESGDLDILAVAVAGGQACVQVFFIRGGRNLGSKSYFPKIHRDTSASEVLGGFLSQYYLQRSAPEVVLLSHPVEELALIQQALCERQGRKLKIVHRVRGQRARWLDFARRNVQQGLTSELLSKTGMQRRLQALAQALALQETPQRIECFDISHTSGEDTVASCVVFGPHGPVNAEYRRFNIKGVKAGDDYAAMRQALSRRYTRLIEEEGKLPDLVLIDGGRGQLQQAAEVFAALQLTDISLVGIAKGPGRKPGLETIFLSNNSVPIILPQDSAALHLLQQVRDEAHRFAIAGHRHKRRKRRKQSALESIPGIGPTRRQKILKQFGGLQQVKRAGVEDLASVDGISQELAQKIYDAFHSDTN